MFKLAHHVENRRDNIERLAAQAPEQRVALLLAGGDGTRLQELTRQIMGAPIPKQYCRLLRGRSMLRSTLFRASHFSSLKRAMVVVNRAHLEIARGQLRPLPRRNILVQPCNRDTGPGMVFALLQIARCHPSATIAVFPTDHYVDDDRAFIAHVLRAACITARFPDKIAILGVAPDRPEPGYGYILPARPLRTNASPWRVFHVAAFREKPSAEMAQRLISRGGLWNTFVMVFQLARMLELLKGLVPQGSERLLEVRDFPERAPEIYRDLASWNFSTQVLARIPQHLIVLEIADVTWSDWGTQESIERTYRSLHRVPTWQRGPRLPALQTS